MKAVWDLANAAKRWRRRRAYSPQRRAHPRGSVPVFVPMSGAVLSDWGADVIKIEHPETGDPTGGW